MTKKAPYKPCGIYGKAPMKRLSWSGFIVALAAFPVTRWLALGKIAVTEKVGSRALRADAIAAVVALAT